MSALKMSTLASFVIDYVNNYFIPILDQNNEKYSLCVSTWEEVLSNILKNISNFKNDEDFNQKVKSVIHKKTQNIINQQQNTAHSQQQNQNIGHVTFQQQSTSDKQPHINNKLKDQQASNKQYTPSSSSLKKIFQQQISRQRQNSQILQQEQQSEQNNQLIKFRDRKTSVDDQVNRKQQHKNQAQQYRNINFLGVNKEQKSLHKNRNFHSPSAGHQGSRENIINKIQNQKNNDNSFQQTQNNIYDKNLLIPSNSITHEQNNEKARSSFVMVGANNNKQPVVVGRDNEILSFKSISDFHKSRNNLTSGVKEVNSNNNNNSGNNNNNNKQVFTAGQSSHGNQQLKMLSKKSIDQYVTSNNNNPTTPSQNNPFTSSPISITPLTQSRPNSYSSNYIDSIKKINLQSRSPNQKAIAASKFYQLDTSYEYNNNRDNNDLAIDSERIKQQQIQQQQNNNVLENLNISIISPNNGNNIGVNNGNGLSAYGQNGSSLSNIKRKISQGGDYLTQNNIGANKHGSSTIFGSTMMNNNNANSSSSGNQVSGGGSQSFSKFMNSFKKLCNTFQSNHQKLLRQDFNNRYVNC